MGKHVKALSFDVENCQTSYQLETGRWPKTSSLIGSKQLKLTAACYIKAKLKLSILKLVEPRDASTRYISLCMNYSYGHDFAEALMESYLV